MPKIFRTMRKDADDMPKIANGANCLGVRPSDVDLDANGKVELNRKGMSVSPSLKALPHFLTPKRLKGSYPKATGSNSLFCFFMGDGPFIETKVDEGLALVLDSPSHGLVVPDRPEVATLTIFEANLAATRHSWKNAEGVEA